MAAFEGALKGFKDSFQKWIESLFKNPVLTKELRIGLREKKVFFIQIIYMIILGIVAFFFLLDVANRRNYRAFQEAGRNFFIALCTVQWILVVLISPSLTSSALSSEREKKTLETLMVTLLTASDIIMGKLLYAVSYIFLLLASSLPLVALVFFLGGVSPWEIIINYTALMLWGLIISMMALFFSSRESRSANATNSAYGVTIVGGLVLSGVYLRLLFESGRMLGFSFQFPEILAWLALYFNVTWAFLFFFYKTANNLRPRAHHILRLHKLFVTGFLVNILGVLALIAAASRGISGITSITFSNDEIATILSIVMSASLFFLGCFIERHRFLSSKEEDILKASLTSRHYFFPVFFMGVFLLVSGLFFIVDPTKTFQIGTSIVIFGLVIWTLIIFTKQAYEVFAGKIRPVFIYFSVLLAANILPLFTWLINSALKTGAATPSIFSFIFVQPIFAIYSVWDPTGEFSEVAMFGMDIPTLAPTIVFYLICPVALKGLGFVLSSFRKKMVKPVELPPPEQAK